MRILLIELLDAMGSDPRDTRVRAHCLRALDHTVRAAILDPRSDGASSAGPLRRPAQTAAPHWPLDAEGLRGLAGLSRSGTFDLILVASASGVPDSIASRLPVRSPVLWWPTALGDVAIDALDSHPPRPRSGEKPRTARPLLIDGDEPPGLAWATCEPGTRLDPLSLWDGDYVLAPDLGHRSGPRILEAWSQVVEERSSCDLVVLSDPRPELDLLARRLGVWVRVHWVGHAPRGAEGAWWRHASAALLGDDLPISAGSVLRGMAAGCPMIAVNSDSGASPFSEWLAGREAGTVASSTQELSSVLDQALERDARVESCVKSARLLARAHNGSMLSKRLARALAQSSEERPAAA